MIGPLRSAGLSSAYCRHRDQGRLITVLPDLQYEIVHRPPNELSAVKTGLPLQFVKLLNLLLSELNLRQLFLHAIPSQCAHWLAVLTTVALIARYIQIPQKMER